MSYITTKYRNPILGGVMNGTHIVWPDPAVMGPHEGWYYFYGTDAAGHHNPHKRIRVARTKNFEDFRIDPPGAYHGAIPRKIPGISKYRDWWAPHVLRLSDRYNLYVSLNPDDRTEANGHCIAVATSKKPFGFKFERVLSRGPGYSVIDPFPVLHNSEVFLYWGSFHQPIRGQQLTSDRLRFVEGSSPSAVLWPDPEKKGERLLEGFAARYFPELGCYFGFSSGDNTWERGNYKISAFAGGIHPLDEFKRCPLGNTFLAGNAHFHDPGQIDFFDDALGQLWATYLAIDARDQFVPGTAPFFKGDTKGMPKRVAMIDRVVIKDNRPYILSNSPSHGVQEGPVVHTA